MYLCHRLLLCATFVLAGSSQVHAEQVAVLTKQDLQSQEADVQSIAQGLNQTEDSLTGPPQPVAPPPASAVSPVQPSGPAGSLLMDEVTVTGSRRPVKLNETPSTVYVITSEELVAKGANSVGEAILGVPGVQTNVFGTGSDVHNNFFIRGLPNLGLGVLIDGRLITNLNQEHFDLSDIPVYNVERVEVLTGSGATLYGSNAVGGVINVITKQPKGPLEADLKAEFGGYGYSNYVARYGGKIDRVGYNFGYRKFDTTDNYYYEVQRPNGLFTGIRPNAYVQSKFYDLNLSYDFDDRNRLHLDSYLRGSIKGVTPFSIINPTQPFLNERSEPQFEVTRLTTQSHGVALTFDSDLGLGRDSQLQFLAAIDRNLVQEFSGVDLEDLGTFTDVSALNFQLRHNWQFNPTNNITYGFDYIREFGRSGTNDGELLSFETGASRPAVFALYTWKPLNQLIITAGVRATFPDSINGRGITRVIDSSIDPSLGIRYQITPAFALRGNYQSIYRASNFNDLFGRTTHIGNPFLEPETGNAFDIGLDWQTGNNSLLRLTYFSSDVKNLTDYLLVRDLENDDPRSNATRFRVNYPRVNSSGLEAAFNWRISPEFSVFATETLTDARLVSAPNADLVDGQLAQLTSITDGTILTVDRSERDRLDQSQYPLVPFSTARLGVTYEQPGGLQASLFGNISGGRSVDVNHVGPFDTTHPARLPPGSLLTGYTTVDLSLRVPLGAGVSLNGYIFNLLNTYYEKSYGNAAPGINFRIGLTSTF